MKVPLYFFLLAAAFVLPATSLRAGNFVVTNNTDSDAGSLRAALLAAEATVGEDDTITFQNTLSGAVIDISPTGQLSLSAAGRILISAEGLAQPVTINAFGLGRIFQVGPEVDLELNDLVLAEGAADWGASGSDGEAPTAGTDGSDGGAILNEGSLVLRRCTIKLCLAGNGGRGGHKTDAAVAASGNGGRGGKGGAIFSSGGGASVFVEDCILSENEAGAGGMAGDLAAAAGGTIGQAGPGGGGGAIACEGGSLELVRTLVELNRAGAGGGGGANVNPGTGGSGAIGGNGGGVSLWSATLRISGSTFKNNNAGLGGLGGVEGTADTGGAGGKGGDGGGLWAGDFEAGAGPHVEESLFQANDAGSGRVGGASPGLANGETGTPGGDGGNGGGLFIAGSAGIEWKMVNTTVLLNFAGEGGRGGNGSTDGSAGVSGDAGNGGGIAFSRDGVDYSATLTHVSILSNNGGLPGTGGTPTGSLGADSSGGGIWEIPGGINSGNGITLANSVVALNDAGSIDNVGPFIVAGINFTLGDPQVGVLADNGGPTETVAPELGSPLLDGGGVLVEAPVVDQRGEVRPFNGASDLGAFEAKFQPDARIGTSSNSATHRIDNFYTATGAGQVQAVKLTGTRSRFFYVSAQNDGEIDDDLTITGTKAGRTIRLTAIRTTGGSVNVTAALTAGYQIDSVAPGEVNVIRCSVKARSKKTQAKQTLTYGVRSSVTSPVDLVIAKVTSKKVKKKKKK